MKLDLHLLFKRKQNSYYSPRHNFPSFVKIQKKYVYVYIDKKFVVNIRLFGTISTKNTVYIWSLLKPSDIYDIYCIGVIPLYPPSIQILTKKYQKIISCTNLLKINYPNLKYFIVYFLKYFEYHRYFSINNWKHLIVWVFKDINWIFW